MGIHLKIAVAALVFATGCQEIPNYFVSDTTLARVGRTELNEREVALAVPAGVKGQDSAAFVDLYVDRWVRKQLKLREAEKLFSSSEEDIDRLVEEYRQTLLIRKLDQFYIDRGIDTLVSDEQIAAYYKAHQSDFRLDRPIVKGRILRFPQEYRQSKKLMELMSSTSIERQQDFRDIIEKNGFQLTDFSGSWVDFTEFLSYLPTLRSQNYDKALDWRQVQQMRDNQSKYYFQITDVLRTGDAIPLSKVRANVRRILFKQRQSALIRSHEQELYLQAAVEGDFRIYKHTKTEK